MDGSWVQKEWSVGIQLECGYRKSGVWVLNWSVGIERVEYGYSIDGSCVQKEWSMGTQLVHGYRKSGVWVLNWSVGIERVEYGYSNGAWVQKEWSMGIQLIQHGYRKSIDIEWMDRMGEVWDRIGTVYELSGWCTRI